MYGIYKKTVRVKTLSDMVRIMTKIKLRIMNFGYMITVNVTIMYIKFEGKLWVLLKDIVQLCS